MDNLFVVAKKNCFIKYGVFLEQSKLATEQVKNLIVL